MSAASETLPKSHALLDDVRAGQVVLFAGAGISLGTHGQNGLPSAQLRQDDGPGGGFLSRGTMLEFRRDRRTM